MARCDEKILVAHLGKMGTVLWAFANGYDDSPVRPENTHAPIKSVGNSVTTPRDLETDEDGQEYRIDRVKDKRRAASTKAGGVERGTPAWWKAGKCFFTMRIIICGLWKEPEHDEMIYPFRYKSFMGLVSHNLWGI